MDVERTDALPEADVLGGVDVRKRTPWSITRLIGLVDDAIDSAGAQLARSAGLMADPPNDPVVVHRPVVRRKPAGSCPPSAESLLADSDAERAIETPGR
jgi:hypothetical protein